MLAGTVGWKGIQLGGIVGKFFRGSRRKVGVLTLMMACIFLIGWIRSPFVEDSIEIPIGRHSTVSLISAYSQLMLKSEFSRSSQYSVMIPTWRSIKLWDGIRWYDDPPTVFRWKWNGFAFAEVPYQDLFDDAWQDFSSTYYFVPYWSIVIPLALLSAYLLLTKPRPAKRVTPESQTSPPATPERSQQSPK